MRAPKHVPKEWCTYKYVCTKAFFLEIHVLLVCSLNVISTYIPCMLIFAFSIACEHTRLVTHWISLEYGLEMTNTSVSAATLHSWIVGTHSGGTIGRHSESYTVNATLYVCAYNMFSRLMVGSPQYWFLSLPNDLQDLPSKSLMFYIKSKLPRIFNLYRVWLFLGLQILWTAVYTIFSWV